MKNWKNLTATLLLITFTALGALAQDEPETKVRPDSNRHGFFVGVGVGGGGSTVSYKQGSKHIMEDPLGGAVGSLRVGYAINSRFAVSFEGFGFGSDEDDQDWDLGAGLATATWHPAGGGFFLRAGVGGGGGEFTHPDTGEMKKIERRLAGLFGLGYDWDLGEKFSLGFSVDTITMEADDALGYDEGHVGTSSLSVQFNWFL